MPVWYVTVTNGDSVTCFEMKYSSHFPTIRGYILLSLDDGRMPFDASLLFGIVAVRLLVVVIVDFVNLVIDQTILFSIVVRICDCALFLSSVKNERL